MSKEETDKERPFEFGIYTLGDLPASAETGRTAGAAQRMKEVVQAAILADEAGLDVFGVGEHHRLDFAISSPPVVLAAAAQATSRIRLTSATTILATADPVRVFEDFSTLDLLSGGRAELIIGRGAYVESFPLFGYDPADSTELFEEKTRLLQELNEREVVSWSGRFRPALNRAEIAPRPEQARLPLWQGVGGTPASAELAGRLGTGMALAILDGEPERYKPLVDAYRQAGVAAGCEAADLKVAVTGHCYVGRTPREARDEFYPHYASYYTGFMGRGPLTRDGFDLLTGPEKALAVGSPDEIVEKILRQHELFRHDRFMAQLDIGGMPYAKVAAAIELLATKVAPAVRQAIRKSEGMSEGRLS